MAFDLDLDKIDGGSVMERYRYAALKVLTNCLDPATSFKGKRSITVKVTVEPNEHRNIIDVTTDVQYKLCPPIASVSKMTLSKDFATGKIHIQEYGSCIPGQSSLQDYGTDESGNLIIPDDQGREIIDFRNKGKERGGI